MAAKKIGTVIKEARTAAGLSQEQLARKVAGVSTADLGKVELGEADFTQEKLKAIAKALGVTQASLLNAPKNLAAKKPAAKTSSTTGKTTSAKTTAAKKPAANAGTAKTAAAKTPKTPANANSTMKVTAAERKLIEYYRTASGDAKKAGTKILKGECSDLLDSINNKGGTLNAVGDVVTDFIGGALSNLLGGKK